MQNQHFRPFASELVSGALPGRFGVDLAPKMGPKWVPKRLPKRRRKRDPQKTPQRVEHGPQEPHPPPSEAKLPQGVELLSSMEAPAIVGSN